MERKQKNHKNEHVLNYCRWIVFGNNAVKYNVGKDSHKGWYVDECGYWKYKNYFTHEIKRGIEDGCTTLGHTNEDYDFVSLRKFLTSAYQ